MTQEGINLLLEKGFKRWHGSFWAPEWVEEGLNMKPEKIWELHTFIADEELTLLMSAVASSIAYKREHGEEESADKLVRLGVQLYNVATLADKGGDEIND